ncbi:hypothetical protein NOK12_11950 [Nocardioides sp. OK12]|uniref:hypothetical protein n=1 Tax=Nocardioides sp. OK12 TaxID=2758661 RepID=UPI0021C323DD|nr:hypothetical protein [Nocardioides sp. OK12]GHJ58677.1 hypothetical protein NOK12_11950 [Nocardioides sp. OK12]
MHKLIAASVGAALLAPGAATSASDGPYTSPFGTDVAFRAPSKVAIGEKIRVKVRVRTDGDAGEVCTGDLALLVKNDDDVVVKHSRKPVDNRREFGFKLRSEGPYRLAVKYQRGDDDPCGKSREGKDLRVTKRGS